MSESTYAWHALHAVIPLRHKGVLSGPSASYRSNAVACRGKYKLRALVSDGVESLSSFTVNSMDNKHSKMQLLKYKTV